MMKDFKTGIDGTGTTSATGKNRFRRTMLRGEALREFVVIAGQVVSTNNTHLKKIKEGLLSYFFPQRDKQAETRHEECHEETSISQAQDIFITTNVIKQLPSTFPRLKQLQEDEP